MNFTPIERSPNAFQQSVTAGQVEAMCHRAFGPTACAISAVELGWGTYNNTFRVDIGADRPIILRVAPERHRQARIERELMHNEHASVPYLAPVAVLTPRTLAIDFTQDVIGRDYLFQTMLDGVPAPDGLANYPRAEWATFFRALGTIARSIHDVRGARFGPVAGPTFRTWSAAVIVFLGETAADLEDAGLDASDVREVLAAADRQRAVLDQITEPRLLHGDLWTVNVMIESGAPEPTITGVCDCDRTSWGDPQSDWTILRAGLRPGTERDAFWDTYGSAASTPDAARRMLIYRARDVGAARLERYRLGKTGEIPASYDELRDLLAQLTS